MARTHDLAIIGSGTAAQVAAGRVRKAGWSVAVIDHRPFGGTCALRLRGCDPKKMLISGAEAIDAAQRMRGHGVKGGVAINWHELIAFKRTFTDPIPAKQEKSYAERGIDAFHGRARFTGRNTLAVEEQELAVRHILIATGARPVPLRIPGEEHAITSDRFLELEYLPSVSRSSAAATSPRSSRTSRPAPARRLRCSSVPSGCCRSLTRISFTG
jgi:glutathione reductase (NADPH)